MVVSSANRTVESGGMIKGRSLMKAEKRVGPSTEPWGTREEERPGEEKESATRVTWQRFKRYD